MKNLLILLTFAVLLSECSKDDMVTDEPNSNKPTPLPKLPDPDDVCSCMDDLTFMKYCYDKFDVNGDGKVSRMEADKVKEIDFYKDMNSDQRQSLRSLQGIGYFSNLERITCRECKQFLSIDLSNNLKIESIGEGDFYCCTALNSILLPNSVTSIGEGTFHSCSSLKSINIPDGVTSIGERAFYYCSSLTSIVIPDGVTSIGGGAFSDCSSLKSINIPDGVTSIDGIFYGCSSLQSVNIPNGVTSIGAGTFWYCSSLQSIVIPNGVTSIENYTFCNCSNLQSIVIPDGVTSIGERAFHDCSSLQSITIPQKVNSIGDYAFWGCTGLSAFYGKYASEDHRCLIQYGTLLAFAPAGLTEYTIPDHVVAIGNDAFSNCSSLQSITIPDGVTVIGSNAFSNCSKLTSVYCKATVPPTITNSTFNGGYGLSFYVPTEAVEAYKAAPYWNYYATRISGYDFE